jgi:class 3 adenylate cyclase
LNSCVARELPTGTVTFVFTDVEGSTRLLRLLGTDAYAAALAEHRRALREAFVRHDGVEVDTQGDSFFIAFSTAPAALAAAVEAQQVLAAGPIRVRMGITPGRRTSPRRAMSDRTSTEQPASRRPGTVGRSWSRRRPHRWSTATACATSANTA